MRYVGFAMFAALGCALIAFEIRLMGFRDFVVYTTLGILAVAYFLLALRFVQGR